MGLTQLPPLCVAELGTLSITRRCVAVFHPTQLAAMPQKKFMKEGGGGNACADLYARYFRWGAR